MYVFKHGTVYILLLVSCLILTALFTVPLILLLGESWFLTTILISMTFQFALFGGVTAACYKYLFDFNVFDISRYKKPSFPLISIAALGGLTVGFFPSAVLDYMFHGSETMDLIQQLVNEGLFFEKVYFLLMAAIVGPIIEELMFRGYLWDLFKTSFSNKLTLLFTTLIFAAMHIDPVQSIGVFFIGLYFGWLRMRTDSILVPIVAHIGNNIAASVIIFGFDIEQAAPHSLTAAILMVFLISMLMLGAVTQKKE